MSETITLIAGIMLTSAGLLALLPFVAKLGREALISEDAYQTRLRPALAAANAFVHPELHFEAARSDLAEVNQDVEELLAHLFSLRMTVSEVTAEVSAVHDVLLDEVEEPGETASATGEDADRWHRPPEEGVG